MVADLPAFLSMDGAAGLAPRRTRALSLGHRQRKDSAWRQTAQDTIHGGSPTRRLRLLCRSRRGVWNCTCQYAIY